MGRRLDILGLNGLVKIGGDMDIVNVYRFLGEFDDFFNGFGGFCIGC